MAPTDILDLLIAERDKIDRAIEVLQGPIRRRGRLVADEVAGDHCPPLWPSKLRRLRAAAALACP